MRRPTRAAAGRVGVLALVAACRREAAAPEATSAAAARLAGVWDATFVLTAPPLGVDTAALRRSGGTSLHGVLAFVPNHWLAAASAPDDARRARPTAHGSYDLDFAAFGFDPREPDQVPAAVATIVGRGRTGRDAAAGGGDSLTVVLGPGSDRARLLLEGAWHADSVTGTWRLESVPRGGAAAAGRFAMVPRRPAPRGDRPLAP